MKIIQQNVRQSKITVFDYANLLSENTETLKRDMRSISTISSLCGREH